MTQNYSITYEKVKSYEFEEYNFDDWESWFNHTVSQLSNMKRKNPDGSVSNIGFALFSQLESRLKRAMETRFANKDNDSSPYHIFKDVVGEYIVNIEDMVTIKSQMAKLEEILDIFNSVEALTTADPSPQRRDAPTELPDGDESLEEIALNIAYAQIDEYEKEVPSSRPVMGRIMAAHPQYRSDSAEVEEVAEKMVEKANNEFNSIGLEAIRALVKKDSKKEKAVEVAEKLNIEYYFAMGQYSPEEVHFEIDGGEQQIGLTSLIRKVKDQKLQDKLNRIKPGASEWPVSSTGKYYLIISNDPMLIVTMSTNRSWAHGSCMRQDGAYPNGPFHDVELGNPVTYVLTSDKLNEGWPTTYDQTLKGRNLMKWGYKDSDRTNYGIGFEPTTYPSGRDWGIPMATALGMILTERGHMGYSKCTTPYIYQGWSDLMGSTNRNIIFTGINLYGRNINLDEAQFAPEMAMAQSPMAVYSQINRLTRMSVDMRIKRAVAQNPNIWMYDIALTRLIRSKDNDIYKQLIGCPIAIPDALLEMGKVLEEVGEQAYTLDNRRNNILWDLVRHHNTPAELHHHFAEKYGEEYLSWAYHSQGSPRLPIKPCYAPHDMMDVLVELAFTYPDRGQVMKAVQALAYAPNMDTANFVTLLSKFNKWIRSRRWHTDKGRLSLSEKHTELYQELEATRRVLTFRTLLPFQEGDEGWAFSGEYLGIPTKANDIRQEWRSNYNNLLSSDSISLLIQIVPEILSENDMFNGCILFENLRDWEVSDFLWTNRAKLEIAPYSFMNRPRSSRDISNPVPHLLCPPERVAEAFSELEPSEVFLFKYDFLPNDSDARLEREGVPRPLLNIILSSNQYLLDIGLEPVAMWLVDPKRHFDQYEHSVMEIAIGGLWSEGELLDPPENYVEFQDMIMNIAVMEQAAIGLAKNPRISEDMQYKLLNTWVEISDKYGGSYSEEITFIEDLLVANPAISRATVKRLINNVNYRQILAKNPNCPQSYLTGHKGGGREASLFYQYPVEVLSNPGLSDDNFSRLWTLMDSYLRTEVDADAERLFNRIRTFQQKFMGIAKGVTKRKYVKNTILKGNNVNNWMSYWRGGSSKGTTFETHNRKNLFTEGGGITDYPLSIVGKKSVVLFFNDGVTEENELWFVERMREIKGGNLEIKAKVVKWADGHITEETYEGTQHINEFFKFIPPEERGPEIQYQVCDYCKFRRPESEDALGEHLESEHPDEEIPEDSEGFSYEMVDAPKWNVSSVFMFTDKNPPKAQKVPQWRFTFNSQDLNNVLKVYLSRKPIKTLLRIWENEPYEVYTQKGKNVAKLEPATIYGAINQENMWTEELIDSVIEDLIRNYGVNIISAYNNMGWTDKVLNISLLDDEEEMAKYNLTRGNLEQFRRYLLAKDNLPTWYIYKLFEVSTNRDTVSVARNYRMRPEMIAKYNEYLSSITG